MGTREVLIERLFAEFPQQMVAGPTAPHDCIECSEIRQQLDGATWQEVPADFICQNDGSLPLLSPQAYLLFLPAWLRQGILDPDGVVAGMLLVNLHFNPPTDLFNSAQAQLIIDVATFLTSSNIFGPSDPVNIESLAEIQATWARAAA
jgi:hypothetical protein